MTKFRPHRGSLADSMAEVVEISNLRDLAAHIEKILGVEPSVILVEPYAIGGDDKPCFDGRIGWHTYIVTSGRGVLGFTDGPLPEPEVEPPTRDWIELARAAVTWREARQDLVAEAVANVRKSGSFADVLNRLSDAEDKLSAAALAFTPTCPFCKQPHAGSLPCRHCGEPDIPTPDDD